nr:MAG TPA: hypothetical protein [Caudoviricetes sp.]
MQIEVGCTKRKKTHLTGYVSFLSNKEIKCICN